MIPSFTNKTTDQVYYCSYSKGLEEDLKRTQVLWLMKNHLPLPNHKNGIWLTLKRVLCGPKRSHSEDNFAISEFLDKGVHWNL